MTNDAVPSSLVSSSLFQSEITDDSNRSAPYQIAVSLREILESRGQTMERIFNRNAPLDQRLMFALYTYFLTIIKNRQF